MNENVKYLTLKESVIIFFRIFIKLRISTKKNNWRNALLRSKFTAPKAGEERWCRGRAVINHWMRKGEGGEVKRKEGRRYGGETRSWEPYTRLLKWGMRVKEVKFSAERGRGGALQHGSCTQRLYLSKLIPRLVIQTHRDTGCVTSRWICTKYTHTHTFIISLTLSHARTNWSKAKSCPLALFSKLVLRPVECFTVALGANTQILWSKVGR